MCGRYTFIPNNNFYRRFEIENRLEQLENLYNVSPGQEMPVITHNSPNQVVLMHWGLIPFWSKDSRIALRAINARAENIATKPAFRKPIKDQRCLIPANGFYEWDKKSTRKQPYYFQLKNHEQFAFAGLYDIWENERGLEVKTYTIITTEANHIVEKIHDRMPAILTQTDEDAWLDHNASLQQILELLEPYSEDLMYSFPVSFEINCPKVNNPQLIKPII